MITLAVAFTFIGFFLAYSTSKRAQPVNGPIRDWARKRPKYANRSGILLLAAGLVLTVFRLGWGAGIFSYLVVLMMLGSLTVLVTPLSFFSVRATAIIAVFFFLVEINLS